MTNIYLVLIIYIVFNGLAAVLIRLLGKNVKKPELPSFLFQFLGALIFVFFIKEFPPISSVWLIPIAAGFFYGVGGISMFKAFEKGEVSFLSPMGNLNPAIIFIFSIILLRETISLPKILGITLIIYGLSFLKKQKNPFLSLKEVVKDKSCQYYFIFLLTFALARTFDKRATLYFETITYTFLQFIIPSLFVLLFILYKKEFSSLVSFAKKKFLLAIAAGAVIGIKYAAFYLAISQAELSRISPFSSLSVLTALFFAAILLKEKVERRWWAAILMIIGAGVLAYKL